MRRQIDLAAFGALEDGTILARELDVHVVAEQKDAGKSNDAHSIQFDF